MLTVVVVAVIAFIWMAVAAGMALSACMGASKFEATENADDD